MERLGLTLKLLLHISPSNSDPDIALLLLTFLVVCCIVGMIYFVRACFRRRRSYKRYRRYQLGHKLSNAKDAELPPSYVNLSDSTLQRIHGAGLVKGFIPNPREWWECVRNWSKYRMGVRGDLQLDETWVVHKFLLEERAKESLARRETVMRKAMKKAQKRCASFLRNLAH